MAWALIKSGEVERIINTPISIQVNGVTHPSSIFRSLSNEDLKNLGILPYEEEQIDTHYYNKGVITYSVGPDKVLGTYEATGKDIDSLKEGMLNKTREVVSYLLRVDDWMAIREFEGGTPIPNDIKTYRANIRAESNIKETEINSLVSLVDIINYENKNFIEVRKLIINTTDENGISTSTISETETEDIERQINMVTHYETIDPRTEEDPSFVSLTAV